MLPYTTLKIIFFFFSILSPFLSSLIDAAIETPIKLAYLMNNLNLCATFKGLVILFNFEMENVVFF